MVDTRNGGSSRLYGDSLVPEGGEGDEEENGICAARRCIVFRPGVGVDDASAYSGCVGCCGSLCVACATLGAAGSVGQV